MAWGRERRQDSRSFAAGGNWTAKREQRRALHAGIARSEGGCILSGGEPMRVAGGKPRRGGRLLFRGARAGAEGYTTQGGTSLGVSRLGRQRSRTGEAGSLCAGEIRAGGIQSADQGSRKG